MKRILMIIICCLMLCGCGSGISKKEYDLVVTERDDLQSKLDNLEQSTELKTKVLECKAKINAEYEHAIFVLKVGEKISGENASETISAVNELYDTAINTIDSIVTTVENIDSAAELKPETYKTTIDSIEGIYETWSDTYNGIKNIEDYIMGS